MMDIQQIIILFLFLLMTFFSAHTSNYKLRFSFCNQAPNPALEIICSQLHKWDSVVRHHSSSTTTWSAWSSAKVWSDSRSRWSVNTQSWSTWTSWTSTYSAVGPSIFQSVPMHRSSIPQNVRNTIPRNEHPHGFIPTIQSTVSPVASTQPNVVLGPTPREQSSQQRIPIEPAPKRVAFEIQYEFSSKPGEPLSRTRAEYTSPEERIVTNSKKFTQLLSSLSTARRREKTIHQTSSIPSSSSSLSLLSSSSTVLSPSSPSFPADTPFLRGPPRSAPITKDLYTLEQETVGPPGHQRPNLLLRNDHQTPSVGFSTEKHADAPQMLRTQNPQAAPQISFTNKNKKMLSQTTAKDYPTALDCMDLNCLCPYLHGTLTSGGCYLPNGEQLQKAVRKEIRQLSISERMNFFAALERLKYLGEYDWISQWHSHPEMSGGAHSGPAFLPWHREYIKRFEIALRLLDPTVSLPYWDSTLDGLIPRSNDTCLFTSKLMGEGDYSGNIKDGFMAYWRSSSGHYITRYPGQQGRLLNDQDIQEIMRHNDLKRVMAYTAPQPSCPYQIDWSCLEYNHANALIWVGGDLFQQTTSANDPLFFLHHAFVDSIWERWRQRRQSPMARSHSYPPDLPECSSADHFAQSPMRPFMSMRNIDGISNNYTNELYQYAPRPSCNGYDEQCASEFLFCDLSHGHARCSTKIRMGGNCDGYNHGENPCYEGICRSNMCIKGDPTARAKRSRNLGISRNLVSPGQDSCYNSHECCYLWSKEGRCAVDVQLKCPASCGLCEPTHNISDECANQHQYCEVWAAEGECEANPHWMSENCKMSCQRCHLLSSKMCQLTGS